MTRCAVLLLGLLALAVQAAEEKVFLWSYKTDGLVQLAPISDGSWIFVGTAGGSVHALDERGTRAWKTGFSKRGGASAEIKHLFLLEGALVVELVDGGSHAINARSGKPCKPPEGTDASPDSSVEQITFEGRVVRVKDSESGDVVWSRTLKHDVTCAALLHGTIVMGLDDATVQAWGPQPEIRDRTVDEL